MEVDHHDCSLVHRPLRTLQQLAALLVIPYRFVPSGQDIRVQFYLAFELQLVLSHGLFITIATDRLVIIEDLVVFAYERALLVLHPFDRDWLSTGLKHVQVIALNLSLASDQLSHAVEKVVAGEVVEGVLEMPVFLLEYPQSFVFDLVVLLKQGAHDVEPVCPPFMLLEPRLAAEGGSRRLGH